MKWILTTETTLGQLLEPRNAVQGKGSVEDKERDCAPLKAGTNERQRERDIVG